MIDSSSGGLINRDFQPLVSLVTPVYNGEKYLAECVESVLNQTYDNWEYTIVNNCSNDRTREIAQRYTEKDRRIRIHDNETFVGVIENHNVACSQISAVSKYCKFVEADDWLFPECIKQMIRIAESNPSVGIVGCYGLGDSSVYGDGLPYPSNVVPGRELARRTLCGGPNVFGSPTSQLIRSDLVRNHMPFYNEANIHADTEACYKVLRNSDFGFVHQVLVYTRVHNESVTSSFSTRLQTHFAARLLEIKKYGPIYLNHDEFSEQLRLRTNTYYQFLAKSLLLRRDKEFWKYHRDALETAECPFASSQLIKALLLEAATDFLHPGKTLRKVFVRVRKDSKLMQTGQLSVPSESKKSAETNTHDTTPSLFKD